MLGLRDKRVLEAIIRHCEKIMRAVPVDMERSTFYSNKVIQDACVFNLLQIGELAKEQLPDACKQDLKVILGMRL